MHHLLSLLTTVSLTAPPVAADPVTPPVQDAASPITQAHRAVVSPAIGVLNHLRQTAPRLLQEPAMVSPGIATETGFVGSVRFHAVLNDVECAALEARGLRFTHAATARSGRRVDRIGTVYPVFVPWSLLDDLTRDPRVAQIDSEPLLTPTRPLEVTRALIDADVAAERLSLTGGAAGEGMTIVDIDSGIDVFHPAFFRADGGYFSWIDVNGNGAFTMNVDAVDLDGNGEASTDEIIRFVDAPEADFSTGLPQSEGYELGLDWLYADTNGDNQRNYGPAAGFDDASPGFGEPLLLVDDVNGNGQLDLDEKLVMLGTSKVKAIRIGEDVYERGQNLITVPKLEATSATAYLPEEHHGTGVSGILVAGEPGLTRHVGIAPAADLIVISNRNQGQSPTPGEETKEPLITALAWAETYAPQVILYEFSSWGTGFMDGTTNLESAMNTLHWDSRISQVVPAGNLADSGKHMSGTITGANLDTTISLPKNWRGGFPFQVPLVVATFYWEGSASAVTLQIQTPSGEHAEATPGLPAVLKENVLLYCNQEKSTVGFNALLCYVYHEEGSALPIGDWLFRLTASGGAVAVHGYANDPLSGWSRGATFAVEDTATTLCVPSTADTAISVAAYGGRHGSPEEIGNLRDYSSRGPRMDGATAIDITAPDDPYAPLATVPAGTFGPQQSEDLYGAWSVFGGTSGAGPHVAGTVLLMKQANPGWPSERVKVELQQAAITSADMGALPNAQWGYGKLDTHRAVFGEPAPDNSAPEADASLRTRTGLVATLSATGSTDPDQDALSYQWDVDYDGVPDSEWSASPELEWTYPAAGRYLARVTVRDVHGATDSALTNFEVADDAPQVAEPAADGVEADAGGTTGGGTGGTESTGSGESSGCTAADGHPAAPWGPLALLLMMVLLYARLARRQPGVDQHGADGN